MDDRSSAEYPNASATARTPSCSLESALSANEPYRSRTASSICFDTFISFLNVRQTSVCRKLTNPRSRILDKLKFVRHHRRDLISSSSLCRSDLHRLDHLSARAAFGVEKAQQILKPLSVG